MTHRMPFIRGQLFDQMQIIGECTCLQLASSLKMGRGAVSKLLSRMVDDDEVLHRAAHGGRLYRLKPGAERPIDARGNNIPPHLRRVKHEVTSYDTAKPWVEVLWPYFPYGLESQYCARLDARVVELCPQNLQAAD